MIELTSGAATGAMIVTSAFMLYTGDYLMAGLAGLAALLNTVSFLLSLRRI